MSDPAGSEGPSSTAGGREAYDGFISYSHEVRQKAIASALQRALHSFAKPWYRLRAVRLYRDATNLSAAPDLIGAILREMDRARFFLLLASPAAASSRFMEREATHWLDTRGEANLLIVVTDGRVAWDAAASRFDPAATDCLPPALMQRMTREPFWLDLTWVGDPARELRITDTRFLDIVASLSATLRERPKDALIGEDVRQRRRALQLAWGGVAVMALLTVLSLTAAAWAVRQAEEARREEQRATRWAEQRLFTMSILMSQQVEENRSFTTLTRTDVDGLTFGMYLGWGQRGGRLGRLLAAMREADRDAFDRIFADGRVEEAEALLAVLTGPMGGLRDQGGAQGSSPPRFDFGQTAWQDRFRQAGALPAFQRVQARLAQEDFSGYHRIVRSEMPALVSERGVLFMVDVMVQTGPRAAHAAYRAAVDAAPAAAESALLEAVESRLLERMRGQSAAARLLPAIERRRVLFRTTPLLLDEPLVPPEAARPGWGADITAWLRRTLQPVLSRRAEPSPGR